MFSRSRQQLFVLYQHVMVWILLCSTSSFVQAANPSNTNTPDWFQKIRQGVSGTDWQKMLNNFAQSFPAIEQLIKGIAYLIGIAFVVRALYYLKIYGELRTMMSSNSSLRPPLTYLLVAAVFIFFPSAMDTMMSTVFATPEIQPLSYVSETASPEYGVGLRSILAFIQLIGYIAFVRGWMIIAHTSQQGAGRDTLGKGLTHIIGGVLAINVVGTRDIIWNTLGLK